MERNRNRGREENEKESEGDEQQYSVDLLRNYSTQDSFSFRHSQSQSHEFIIRPDNRWYVAWSNFILIWAIYSSFFTPLEFGFFRGLPENLFLLDVAGQFTFSVDIFVSFFVAYTDAHSYCLVYDRRLIAARYLKSRFLIDLLGCLPWDLIYRRCGEKELVRYMLWIRLSRAVRVTDFFEKMEKDMLEVLFIPSLLHLSMIPNILCHVG